MSEIDNETRLAELSTEYEELTLKERKKLDELETLTSDLNDENQDITPLQKDISRVHLELQEIRNAMTMNRIEFDKIKGYTSPFS